MRKSILFVILIFNTISCKSQKREEINKTIKIDSMEYFDVKKYEKLEKDNNYTSSKNDLHYIDKEFRYRIILSDEIYVEERRNNSPYECYKMFSKVTNTLIAKRDEFYSFPIGITLEYDETGKIIKEINNDLPYKFSIDDLRRKIKKEYDVDIVSDYRDSDPTLIIVTRWEGYHNDFGIYKKGVPMYQVKLTTKKGTINLEINAITGETITEVLNNY